MSVTKPTADEVHPGGNGPQLEANALSLTGVIMQAATHIAPAVGMVLSVGFIGLQAGIVSPVAFAIAFVIILALGANLSELAKHFPSAGGFFTYLSKTLGPKVGFFTAWNFFSYEPLGAAINLAWMSATFQTLMKEWYQTTIPWWLFYIVATLAVGAMQLAGVKLSVKLMVILGALEIAIMVVLGLFGLGKPGPGGFNLKAFNPANASSGNGLFLGVVFAIFAFTGFESVAPLAEETANPKRNLPRAIFYSILAMGTYYVIVAWMLGVGWGTNDVEGLTADANPVFTLAERLWGSGKVLVLLAVVNSVIAVSIAANNSASRVFFAMGRAGALPKFLGQVNPKSKAPVNAIVTQTVITLFIGLFFGFVWLKPLNTLFFFGLVITYTLTVIYSLANVGVFWHYWTQRKAEFNVFRHGFLPLATTVALLTVCYKSFKANPAAPFKYALPAAVGWVLLGAVVTTISAARDKGGWLAKAGQVFGDEG